MGGYNYQTAPGHTNGTWHQEMGYGLVDAHAAVLAACATIPVNFANQIVTSDTTITGCTINVQNVKVQNGAKLTLNAKGEVNIGSGFEVELGSEFEIVK